MQVNNKIGSFAERTCESQKYLPNELWKMHIATIKMAYQTELDSPLSTYFDKGLSSIVFKKQLPVHIKRTIIALFFYIYHSGDV